MQCQFANNLHEQIFVGSFGRSDKLIQQRMTKQETRNKPCGQFRLRVAQAAHICTGGSNVGNKMQAHAAARIGDSPGSGLFHAWIALAAARKCKSHDSKAQQSKRAWFRDAIHYLAVRSTNAPRPDTIALVKAAAS